jgi:hypothetical protein
MRWNLAAILTLGACGVHHDTGPAPDGGGGGDPNADICHAPTGTVLANTDNEIIALALGGDTVAWLDIGGVRSVPRTGGTVTQLQGSSVLGGFITAHDDRVYWTNDESAVASSAVAGGDEMTLVTTHEPIGIAVDDQNVYWSTFGSNVNNLGTVDKMPLAGGPTTVLASGLATVGPIAVDATNVYWTDMLGGVSSVPIAGGAVTTLVPPQYAIPPNTILDDSPPDIAVDATAVYWTSTPLDHSAPTVNRLLLGGGPINTITDVTILATLASQPAGLTVDASRVYWVEDGAADPSQGLGSPITYSCGTLRSVPIEGGDANVLETGLSLPYGPIVDDTHAYVTSGAFGGELLQVAK